MVVAQLKVRIIVARTIIQSRWTIPNMINPAKTMALAFWMWCWVSWLQSSELKKSWKRLHPRQPACFHSRRADFHTAIHPDNRWGCKPCLIRRPIKRLIKRFPAGLREVSACRHSRQPVNNSDHGNNHDGHGWYGVNQVIFIVSLLWFVAHIGTRQLFGNEIYKTGDYRADSR